MKLNHHEKKIINGILDSRKARYETPRRKIDGPYRECKQYEAAISLMLKKIVYAESTNELLVEGPALPDPEYRWFVCRPWKTKRELRKHIWNIT